MERRQVTVPRRLRAPSRRTPRDLRHLGSGKDDDPRIDRRSHPPESRQRPHRRQARRRQGQGRDATRASPQAGRPRAPTHDSVPAPHSRTERGLWDPSLPRPRPCRGAARTPRSHRTCPSAWRRLVRGPTPTRGARAGRSRARSACCCSTSPSRLSTSRHVRRYACSRSRPPTSTDAAGILVTHDLAEAQAFGEQLGIIDDGRLLQLGGAHEVVLSPSAAAWRSSSAMEASSQRPRRRTGGSRSIPTGSCSALCQNVASSSPEPSCRRARSGRATNALWQSAPDSDSPFTSTNHRTPAPSARSRRSTHPSWRPDTNMG